MKNVKGRLKLERGDRRVGNFVYTDEGNGFIKVQDVNGFCSHRVSEMTLKGRFLREALDGGRDDWLRAYAVVMYNVLLCVPDSDFLGEVNRSAVECTERHGEMYGLKRDRTDADDERAMEDVERDEELAGEVGRAMESSVSPTRRELRKVAKALVEGGADGSEEAVDEG